MPSCPALRDMQNKGSREPRRAGLHMDVDRRLSRPVHVACVGAEPHVPAGAGAEPCVPAGVGAEPRVSAGVGAEPRVPAGVGAEPLSPCLATGWAFPVIVCTGCAFTVSKAPAHSPTRSRAAFSGAHGETRRHSARVGGTEICESVFTPEGLGSAQPSVSGARRSLRRAGSLDTAAVGRAGCGTARGRALCPGRLSAPGDFYARLEPLYVLWSFWNVYEEILPFVRCRLYVAVAERKD